MKSTPCIVAVALLASCMQQQVNLWYGSEQQPITDTAWLGDPKPSSMGEGLGSSSEFDITLEVVPGDLAALEPTRNVTYWSIDGQCSQGMRAFVPGRTYLVGTIRPATKYAGRLARCTVRILGGPLRDAVVCIKPDDWVRDVRDPSYTVFEVPQSVVLHPGYVPFRVVNFMSK